ncbi:hypothetical protein Lal_00039289 [Lupinus albus]|nr:hypothetical protein Lal_00039289 [Lupinus albus]
MNHYHFGSNALAQARDSRSSENLIVPTGFLSLKRPIPRLGETPRISNFKTLILSLGRGPLAQARIWQWGQRNLNYRVIPRGDLTEYRSRLDRMDVNDFKWLPYENYVNNLPHEVLQDKNIWNRVRLQFKLLQDLPQPPQNLDALHRVDKQGNLDTNWANRHAEWIDYWSHRRDQVQQGRQIQYSIHTQQYIMWYRRNTILIFRNTITRPPTNKLSTKSTSYIPTTHIPTKSTTHIPTKSTTPIPYKSTTPIQ